MTEPHSNAEDGARAGTDAPDSAGAARGEGQRERAAAAGRGVVYIAAAKGYFMAAGYAIVFTLPRLLGDKMWGEYTVVIALASVINNVIVTGTIQGVSRYTSQVVGAAAAGRVRAAGLRMQLGLGAAVALAYLVAAPWIAAAERDAALAPLYRVSALIVACYSFYAVLVGSLNGQQRFGHQAALDVTFATLRAGAILGAAALGLGALGAVGGFSAAACVILVVAALLVRRVARSVAADAGGADGAGPSASPTDAASAAELWRLTAKLFVYNGALNLLMRTDLLVLKRVLAAIVGSAGAGAGAGASATSAAAAASVHAGYYASAQYLAFIPYQAVLAVAFVVFPLVSRATFQRDGDTARSTMRSTLRLSLLGVVALASVLIAKPAALIDVPFAASYRVAGPALRLLAAAMIALSLFTVVNAILNAAGHTRAAIISGLFAVSLAAGAAVVLISGAASPADALLRAAAASALAMGAGAALSLLLLWRAFGVSIPALTALRVTLAGAAAVGVGVLLPEAGAVATLAESALVLVVYLAALALIREVGTDELAMLRRVLGRR